MTRQYFSIGTTYAGLTNVESLTSTQLPNMAPRAVWRDYSESVTTGDNGAISRGSAVLEWRWDGPLGDEMLDALRVIIPGASAAVYIRSRKDDGAEETAGDYLYYTATAIWPSLDSYEFRAGSWLGFVLTFRNLVVYTPPT